MIETEQVFRMTHRILKDQRPYIPPRDNIPSPPFRFWHSTFGIFVRILGTSSHALSYYTSVYPKVNEIMPSFLHI